MILLGAFEDIRTHEIILELSSMVLSAIAAGAALLPIRRLNICAAAIAGPVLSILFQYPIALFMAFATDKWYEMVA